MPDLQEAKSATASVSRVRLPFGRRLAAAWRASFGDVDVDYIRARVDHWTARHYGFASFDEPQPYQVVREGDRIVVTPPNSPDGSWAFSPGWAEFNVRYLFPRQLQVISFAVDRVWISHHVWTNGRGATDILQISFPGYGSQTVAALDYDLVHNRMRPPGRRFDVSPTLDDPAAAGGIPPHEDPDSTLVAPVAPTIVALSRVIAATTRRPVSTYVEFITEPTYGDAGD
jgi:hypothetical protein